MKRLLLGFGLVAGVAYAVREWFAAPLPQPSWDETDEYAWLDDLQLRLEPGAARRHLRPVRLLVDPSLPAGLPLEVLDGVRGVRRSPVDPGLLERLVEQTPCGTDERPADSILLVS